GLPGGNSIHPADQHLSVDAARVHARPVNVEIAQSHIVEPVHFLEAAQQTFVKDFRGTIYGAIVVGVMVFTGGKLFGHSIHGGRRGRHQAPHVFFDACLQNVESTFAHDLEGEARIFGTLRDTDCRLVKYQIDAASQFSDQGRISDVAFDYLQCALGKRPPEIVSRSAREVVQDNYLGNALVDQLVGYMRSDQPCTTGNQHATILELKHGLPSLP